MGGRFVWRMQVSLKNVDLKIAYDSDRDDILKKFYIPSLSQSISYNRLAGFFNSTSLAVAARGMSRFIHNGGIMRLICSARLTKEDVDAIKLAHEDPANIITKKYLADFSTSTEDFVNDHIKALAWMLVNRRLTIKVALVLDDHEVPLSEDYLAYNLLFHQKVGILTDSEGNQLSFSGSDNESAGAWEGNIEEFKVFRGWIHEERPYLQEDLDKFERFWKGEAKRTLIIDMPSAIKEKLIQIAPREGTELKLERWETPRQHKKEPITLWDYQKSAIEKWVENGMNGIFEMATGTGKTYTALGCLQNLLESKCIGITIVACPYDHLVKQWADDIDEFGITVQKIIADSSNPGWKDTLANLLLDMRNDANKSFIVLTTHDTLASSDFIKILNMSTVNKFLIVDEVHGAGAPELKRGLLDNYRFRLGLSATPKRWFDDEGTEALYKYFDKTVYEFTLEQAIKTINPKTGETYLAPYDYIPILVDLNDDELMEYEKMTAKISKMYNSAKNNDERAKIFSLLCFKRQDIIKNAANKFIVFTKLIEDLDVTNIKHCLIYCSPDQLDPVQDILNHFDVVQHKFTMQEGTQERTEYGGLSERGFLLKKFAEGTYQILVAIKCLDEGVDVPPARTAIIMASTSNPKEWIQRRGRILRRYEGKKKAVIYDLVVLPYLNGAVPTNLEPFEKKVLKTELKRYKEFAKIASNSLECLNKLFVIEKKYGV